MFGHKEIQYYIEVDELTSDITSTQGRRKHFTSCHNVNEHKAAVKYGKSDVSAVAEHEWVDKHDIDFQSVSILAWEPDIHQHLSLESWYIRTLKTFTREIGILDTKYNCLYAS